MKLQCDLDEQQCRDSCEHKGHRQDCPHVTKPSTLNTNQIPPGIIEVKNKDGRTVHHVERVIDRVLLNYLNDGWEIHKIRVDGTEWSVGEKVDISPSRSSVIDGFSYENGEWCIVRNSYLPNLPTRCITKPLPHSGGEEKKNQYCYMCGRDLDLKCDDCNKDKAPTNQGEAGGKSKEETFEAYLGKEYLALKAENESLKQQLKEESHRCKVLVDNLMVVTNLKEKQGWSDESVLDFCQKFYDYYHSPGVKMLSAKDYLNEYKSKTNR